MVVLLGATYCRPVAASLIQDVSPGPGALIPALPLEMAPVSLLNDRCSFIKFGA